MISNKERYQKAIEAAKRQKKRAIERANTPEAKAKRKKKAIESQEKQRAKQLAKLNDPEYRVKQLERQKARHKKQKPKSTRGLKGRTPLAEESRIQDAIGTLPCIACLIHGRVNQIVSLHHTNGRTQKNANAKVLPLCAGHHDTPAEQQVVATYPDLIPFHAKGKLGGKAAWERLNGTQEELLSLCFALTNITPPFETMQADAELVERLLPYLSFP
ncbi:TPA: Ref family recombination enhancement nuclease [Vibrio parahaemolyticus]